MDETFLPSWLLLLLGLWALALTVWQNRFAHHELRFWSGISTIAYLGLFLLTISAGPPFVEPRPAGERFSNSDFVALACLAISLISAIWSLGRLTATTKAVCYFSFTLANAAFCASMGHTELAIALLIVAAIEAKSLHQNGCIASITWSVQGLRTFFRPLPPAREARTGADLLTGAFNVVLTIALIGTLSYSLRTETTRPATGPGHTALPSRDYLKRFQVRASQPGETSSSLDLALGARSDIIVLTAVLVFLTLGSTLMEPNRPRNRNPIDEQAHATIE